MPKEYDYVTGLGRTVSWKRVGEALDKFNVWVFENGEKTQVGYFCDDWERRRLIRVYTDLTPIRDLTQ